MALKTDSKIINPHNRHVAWAYKYLRINRQLFGLKGHRYLRQIYDDQSPEIVILKPVQVGVSTFAISKSIWLAMEHDRQTIYYMPTDKWAERFSLQRVKTEIINQSPEIAKAAGVDQVKMRQFGKAFIHYRGLNTAAAVQETPADHLIYDEFDKNKAESAQHINESRNRIMHSDLRWILSLGVPTIENYGLDAMFRRSTRNYWNITCPGCQQQNVLEHNWPGCLKEVSPDKVIRVCEFCGAELNPESGRWLPENPEAKIQGYHLSQLFAPFVSPGLILEKWKIILRGEGAKYNLDLETFYRETLGIAYSAEEDQILQNQLEACIEPVLPDLKKPGNIMGVDTGKREQWAWIGRQEGETLQTHYVGGQEWKWLHQAMESYSIDVCVIDPGGNMTKADEFAQAFPGRVYQCYYHGTDRKYIDIGEDKKTGILQVTAHRTRTLDFSRNRIRMQKITFPPPDIMPGVGEFFRHTMNLVRKREEDRFTGAVTFGYIRREGGDHLAHAQNYGEIALFIQQSERGGSWKAVRGYNRWFQDYNSGGESDYV